MKSEDFMKLEKDVQLVALVGGFNLGIVRALQKGKGSETSD